MKVVAINGSPRPKGNTYTLLEMVLTELQAEGIETELIQVGGKPVRGCMACYKCAELKNRRCSMDKDIINECIEKMDEADGILLGSPTYFANVSSEMKALIDRAGIVAKVNEEMFRRKVCAGVVAARRAGALPTFDALNHFFTIGQMIVVGSSYWNNGFGLEPGAVKEDEEGVTVMKTLGRNMAWLLSKLHG
jgi:multimeric flavodoxin WrbA